jgi:hypothetical protein
MPKEGYPMDLDVSSLLAALGVNPSIVAVITSIIALASALDAAIPQPSVDSRWHRPRQILSWLAVNLGHARNIAVPKRPADGAGGGSIVPAVLLLVLLAAALPLAACASKSADTQLYTIRAGYDATVLAPAVAYARLPRCSDMTPAPCSRQEVVDEIRKADTSAAAALDAAEAVVRHHPDLDASAYIDAAQQAAGAVRKILITYDIVKE